MARAVGLEAEIVRSRWAKKDLALVDPVGAFMSPIHTIRFL